MTPREALLAAARVCDEIGRKHNSDWMKTCSSFYEGAVDAADECERAILALAEQQPAEPGPETVPVPREPTEAMIEAGYVQYERDAPTAGIHVARIYRAMLAAGSAK